MRKVLGIIAFASDSTQFGVMEKYRTVGSFSFLGRYRIVDFPISNMSNSGLSRIHVHVRKNPRSIINHLGGGRQYNINAKKGGLSIFFGEGKVSDIFNTDVASYYDNLNNIIEDNSDYVVISLGSVVSNINYEEVINEHIANGNDITIVYKFSDEAKEKFINCLTLSLGKEKDVTKIDINHGIYKTRNISLETYVLSKKLFVDLVKQARERSTLYWFKDIVNENLYRLNVKGFAYRGPVYIINSFKAYFDANLELIQRDKAKELFRKDWQVHTKTNDSVPTKYSKDARVSHSLISNGAIIKGTVKNSVIGRGCIVEKDAVVENSVILPGAYVGENVHLNYVVVDKKAVIEKVKNIEGNEQEIVYIERGSKV